MNKWIHLLVAVLCFAIWIWGESAEPEQKDGSYIFGFAKIVTDEILPTVTDAEEREKLREDLHLIIDNAEMTNGWRYDDKTRVEKRKGFGLLLAGSISLLAFIITEMKSVSNKSVVTTPASAPR